MANIYSNMTQKEKDNERAYLTNLQNSGNSGEKEWATNQLKQLNSTTSSTPSYNQTWESGGRTYVGGVDVGPAGTKVDTSNTSSLISAGTASNNSYKPNYGQTSTEKVEYNPYEEAYKEAMDRYNKLNDQIAEQNRLAVEQGTQRLEAQKGNINQAAEDNARQAYIMQMQAKKALPQQLAGQGATGGTTETANLGIQTAYQNTLNDINRNKVNSIQEIDNAIADLKTTGDLATVEQVLANNQAMLNSYMDMLNKGVNYSQWAAQYSSNLESNAYADTLNKAKLMADMGDFSGLKALGYNTDELERQWKINVANTQSLIDQRYEDTKKKGEELSNDRKKVLNSIYDTAFAMYKSADYTPNDVIEYVSKNSSLTDQEQLDILESLGVLK